VIDPRVIISQFLVDTLPKGSKFVLVVVSNPSEDLTEADLDICSNEENYKPILEFALDPQIVPGSDVTN